MFIPSDTSDISNWEWIAGGFPGRDMVREWMVSNSIKYLKYDQSTAHPQTTHNNTKDENLDDQSTEPVLPECPISIISAELKEFTSAPNLDSTHDSKFLLTRRMGAIHHDQKNPQ